MNNQLGGERQQLILREVFRIMKGIDDGQKKICINVFIITYFSNRFIPESKFYSESAKYRQEVTVAPDQRDHFVGSDKCLHIPAILNFLFRCRIAGPHNQDEQHQDYSDSKIKVVRMIF
jgi:hypothetical protein